MVIQQTHVGASVGMAGLDPTAVQNGRSSPKCRSGALGALQETVHVIS